VPVVVLNHWGANLDNFDPRIVEGLAADRPVYALDYRGIGTSGGTAPLSVAEMASDTIATIRALGLTSVDLIGFSLGGFVTQQSCSMRPISSAAPSSPARGLRVAPGSNESVRYHGRSFSKV
jgi:pimeloyl-ACP methyl ester carboxylesterase